LNKQHLSLYLYY